MSDDTSAASNAFAIAGALRSRHRRLSKLKLHKLLFFIQSEHLAWYGIPAFPEEIEAWDNGPVVADLWHKEKYEGVGTGDGGLGIPEDLDNVMKIVLARYRGMSGKDLVEIVHREGPWVDITKGGSDVANQTISHDAMRQYAAQLPEEHEAIRNALSKHPRNRPFAADSPEALDSFFAANA